MADYDSRPDTYAHILQVQRYLLRAIAELQRRLVEHDVTKLESPEREAYDLMTPRLRSTPYGSDEYRATLREMKPAIQHHYEHNPHHPEAHAKGIAGMSLLDLVEMLCDWKAAALRQPESLSLAKSIEVNQGRFGYGDDLKAILLHTAIELEEP
jgi:Family of unknown function (DUF5662)